MSMTALPEQYRHSLYPTFVCRGTAEEESWDMNLGVVNKEGLSMA